MDVPRTTTGRRTGRPRQVVVGYFEDGDDLVTMAMNGWGPAEPAWWLNLQAHPDAIAQTRDGTRPVRAPPGRDGRRDPRTPDLTHNPPPYLTEERQRVRVC